MRVLFIAANESIRWGGSEYCWAAAAEQLAKRGVEVHVSTKRWDEPVKQIEHLRRIGCEIAYRSNLTPPLPLRIIHKFLPPREYVREHLRKVGADADLVVVSQGWHFDGLPWLEGAHSLGYKYSVICEGVAEDWWPPDDLIERLADAWENACAAFFVSQSNVDLTRRMFATALPRARVIRNPFNVRYDASVPWPDHISPLSLAFVSRLKTAAKGHDLLIQALSLPHWRERDIRVSLIGDGPNERTLRRLIEQARLSSIQFAGFSENMELIWANHHALILPSRAEGMPLVLVEAMLCGRPAIATSVGGIPELLRDNINGFLAKAPTVELLDEAMNRAWGNRYRLNEMGQQAARDAREFVPPNPIEDFVQQLCMLANAPREKVTERHEQVSQTLRRDPVL